MGIYIQYKGLVILKFQTKAYSVNPKFFTGLSSINEDIFGIYGLVLYGGIVIFNPHNQSYQFFKEDMPAPQSICGNSIRAIYRDKIGNMWLFHMVVGLVYIVQYPRLLLHTLAVHIKIVFPVIS
jgi:hypothetical protein